MLAQVDSAVWRQDWVVHSQAVGDGRASLKYLAAVRLSSRAISDRRIVSCDNGQVTYSFRKSGSNRWRKMTVDGSEFVRRFLQHVLPTGLQKVRHYGFLSPNSRVSLDLVRWLITLYQGLVFVLKGHLPGEAPDRPPVRCRFLRRAGNAVISFSCLTPSPFPSIQAKECQAPHIYGHQQITSPCRSPGPEPRRPSPTDVLGALSTSIPRHIRSPKSHCLSLWDDPPPLRTTATSAAEVLETVRDEPLPYAEAGAPVTGLLEPRT